MKIFLILLGVVSLFLGLLGIALPLLPTTPFLLLSATLFAHASPRLYDWLLRNPLLGSYIRNYRERKALPRTFKVVSIALLWVTILASMVAMQPHSLWIDLLLFAVAIAVTWHIVSLGRRSSSHHSKVE